MSEPEHYRISRAQLAQLASVLEAQTAEVRRLRELVPKSQATVREVVRDDAGRITEIVERLVPVKEGPEA